MSMIRPVFVFVILLTLLLFVILSVGLYRPYWWIVKYDDYNISANATAKGWQQFNETDTKIVATEMRGVFRHRFCAERKKCFEIMQDNRETFEKVSGLFGILSVIVVSLFLFWSVSIAICYHTTSVKLLILCPVVSLVLLTVTVVVYGVMAKDKWRSLMDKESVTSSRFGYSYWLIIAGLGIDLVLLVLVIGNSFLPSRDSINPTDDVITE